MASYDEDFVEMVANMLMEGRVGFNEIVAGQNETAQNALRQKEQIVVNYFRDVWNIDFYSLQIRVQAALEKMTPPPTVDEVFAYDSDFNGATVNPDDAVSALQPATFHSRFNTAANNVAALAGNYTLDSFQSSCR